ncbi:MAG: methionine adenosyltransferase domain-containing protein [Pseudomonadota bacterium]
MNAVAMRPGETEPIEVVHAVVPGRLRLRITSRRLSAAEARRLEHSLQDIPSVERVHVSPLTGSILVFHNLASAVDQLTGPIAGALGRLRGVSRHCPDPSPTARHAHPWHAITPLECAAALDTDIERGLEQAEADRRLRDIGPNRLPSAEPTPIWRQAAHQFESLPVLLLCGSAILSIGTGAALDGATTLGVVCINAVLGFVTEGQAERTIEALQHNSAALVAVRRMNQAIEISPDHLVPGDVIDVVAGMAAECEVQISYVIGDRDAAGLEIDTFGTGTVSDTVISRRLRELMDLRPGAIAERLDLWGQPRRHAGAFYRHLACYGQIGRDDIGAPWEDAAQHLDLS